MFSSELRVADDDDDDDDISTARVDGLLKYVIFFSLLFALYGFIFSDVGCNTLRTNSYFISLPRKGLRAII